MYDEKLLMCFIGAYSTSRKLMEADMEKLIFDKDFLMIELKTKEWKRCNIVECELEKISIDLKYGKTIDDLIDHYNSFDKLYGNEILNILKEIKGCKNVS